MEAEAEPPSIQYCPPVARTALYYTPILILLLLATVAFRESALISRVFTNMNHNMLDILLIITFIVLVCLLGMLIMVHDLRLKTILRSGAVYGILLLLIYWTGIRIYEAWMAGLLPALTESGPEHATDFSMRHGPDLFLMLFIGGYLVYDGMLKTENLFSRLPEKTPSVIESIKGNRGKEEYQRFLQNRWEGLYNKTVGPRWPLVERRIPLAYLFSVVFVAYFSIVGILSSASDLTFQIDIFPLAERLLIFFTLTILVVVFFQFLILISHLNSILSKHGPAVKHVSDGYDFRLRYDPSHPDNYGGFRDFGLFATRVNVLLIVGGLYGVVRLYLHGFPSILSQQVDVVGWIVHYVGPIFVYLFAVSAWFYLSFWKLHVAMKKGRERRLRELTQRRRNDPDPELLEMERNSPVWPINTNTLLSIASIDLLPLILPFLLVQW